MRDFDGYIRQKAKAEPFCPPDSVREQTEKTLASLPEKKRVSTGLTVLRRVAAAAACFLFVCLFVLPNCSVVYAKALENVPLIGSIVRVVTIRNYFYSDSYHEMNIDVPKIDDGHGDAAAFINKDVDELTKILADRFKEELREIGDEGHSSIYVDYEVVTNTDTWFTLKIRVHEAAGSSNTYYKYYHIDKRSGKIVYLADLFTDSRFHDVLENEIRRQMKECMAEDPDKLYWLDNAEIGLDCVGLDDKHNFYWNGQGDLVIAFDKYEVAPGYMGTPEFAIKRDKIASILKAAYR